MHAGVCIARRPKFEDNANRLFMVRNAAYGSSGDGGQPYTIIIVVLQYLMLVLQQAILLVLLMMVR